MDASLLSFFLKFILISYAAVFFFSAGLALSAAHDLRISELLIFFSLMLIALHFSFRAAAGEIHLVMTAVWTSVLGSGYRFGKKIIKSE